MKNITGILRGLAAPALIACLSATVSLCTGAAARADEALEATVGYYPGALISLPALVAKDQNFFEKDGLKVELVPITTGPAMTSAVASGSITFVNNSWDNLIVAVDKGLPVRGVAGSTAKVPFALLARNGLDMPHLKDGYPAVLKDLVGKKWGVLALGVSLQYMDQKLLTDAGYKTSDVTFLAVGLPNTARPALKRGTVDTYLSIEPLPSIFEAKGEGKVVVNLALNEGPKMFHDLGYNGWWASTSTIDKKPQLVSRFVKAMEDSYCWYSDPANFDQLVAVMQKYAPVPELSADQYKAMVKRLIPTFSPAIDSRTIDTWAKLDVEQGQVAKPKSRAEVIAAVAPETYSCPK
ncbi:MAG: ABC transporter substrate-binding protein [Rhizobiaceae bacterium]|jgi:NitT/TauT family transport system substrate-binding protein